MSIRLSPTFHAPRTYDEAAELLWSLHDSFSVESIGTSATGKGLYALSIGEPSAPAVVYAGADRFSATVLLHFAFTLPTLLSQNVTLHRIHLPTLLAHRRICICPFLCPDAIEDVTPLTNGLGIFLPDCFGAEPPLPEKSPEASALRQYLAYTEPALFCVLQKGTAAHLYPTMPHATTNHLLSRLLATVNLTPNEQEPAFLSIPHWYATTTGHLAYGITLSTETDPLPFLITSPLLIGTAGGTRSR